jgi:hypothetical protein
MPSSTKKQAHYMSAIAHGWNPSGKHPSKAVAEEFHNADKRQGKWEHAEGGMIVQGLRRVPSGRNFNDHDLHEILGNVNGHAKGGLASLPAHLMPQLATPHVSPLSAISNEHIGGISSPGGSFGARARMPRIPISDTLRNIDAHVSGAQIKLPQHPVATGGSISRPRYDGGGEVNSSSPGSPGVLGAVRDALSALRDYVINRPKREMQAGREKFENSVVDDTNGAAPPQASNERADYAGGGQVMAPEAVSAVKKALMHLQQKDAGSAAATLHASPHAMQHPDIAVAAQALRSHQGVAPAQATLQTMQNASQAQKIPAPFQRGGRVR